MKRVTCLMLVCLFLFTISFSTIVSAKNIEGAETISLKSGDTVNANSISIWGNYIFASTTDNGLEIIDMENNSVIAKWNLADINIVPGLNSFSSVQTVVNDDYIICADSRYVIVFPNEGKYTDNPPKAIARITPNPENAMRMFNNLKRMFLADGNLYFFDLTAKNEISAVGGEADFAVMYKVPLTILDDIDTHYTFPTQKWVGLEQLCNANTGAQFITLGQYQYFWNTIKIENNYAYCVTYNDELVIPKKTLYLSTVNLDTLEVSSSNILEGNPSGLQMEFETAEDITYDDIRNLELYVARVEETERVPLGSFIDVENTKYLDIVIQDLNNGNKKVQIMFTAEVINALVDIFDCSEADIVNNLIVFAVDIDGEEKDFSYVTNEVCYDSGVVAIQEDGKFAYVFTGATVDKNMLISVDISDKTTPFAAGSKFVTHIGSFNIAMDAFCAGKRLYALYKGVASRAAVYDISIPGSIPYNFESSLELRSGIYLSNTLSAMVHYGNRYYYADTLGKEIGTIITDEHANFARVFSREGEMPVRLYGYSTDYDEVKITIDGASDEITVPVHNGVWSYNIHMAQSGAHSAAVTIGGYSETFDFNVSAPLPVEISQANDGSWYDADEQLALKVKNNTNKYAPELQNERFDVIAVLYDEEGTARVIANSGDVEIPFGEDKDVTLVDLLNFDVEDYNGNVKIYVMTPDMAPATVEYTLSGRNMTEEETPTVTGNISGIELDDPEVDANNKIITAEGQLNCDGERPVAITIECNGYIYETKQIECGENGRFSYTYSYANDAMSGETTYKISVNAMMGTDETAVSKTATVMDSDAFDRYLEAVKNLNSGKELLEYLETDSNTEKFAREIGLNLDNSDFKALSAADKETVMNEALAIIKSNDRNTLAEVFKSRSAELKKAADIKTAIEEINGATKSSLFGILEKHKNLIGISSDVWNEYSKSKKISTINKYFLEKAKITDLSQVEDYLKKAIKNANNESTGSSAAGPSGGVGGKYTIPVQPEDKTPVDPSQVYNPDKVDFKDLDTVPWAKDAIEKLAADKIVAGISRTEFMPTGNVTREQFVKMLIIAFELENSAAECSFKDVDKNAWYYPYVAAAAECGLAKGDGENFGTGKYMSREEMAVFAYRAAEIAKIKLTEKNEAIDFVDSANIADYAKDAVSIMQKAGILNGTDSNLFEPSVVCSRAMAAKVVYELLNI